MKNLIKWKVKDLGKDFLLKDSKGEIAFIPKENIRILNKNKKLQIISWYFHDIFKKIKFVYWTKEEGRDVFYLEEENLINYRKIKILVKNEYFKNRRYAFFNYGLASKLSNRGV